MAIFLILGGCAVADPRAGDMTVDRDADQLPAGYLAPDPAEVHLDVSYGSDPAQKLDLFLPAAEGGALFVYIHGGGWSGGSKSPIPQFLLRQVSRGYAVASLGYRLSKREADGTVTNPFPAAVHDVKRAIRFLKAAASEHGYDSDRVIVSGGSAGGHLAAYLATTAGHHEPPNLPPTLDAVDSSVQGVVNIVGPTDLRALAETSLWHAELVARFLGCPEPDAENLLTCADALYEDASVNPHIDESDPPTYMAYGELDVIVPEATQGLPCAWDWYSAKGASATWYDQMNGAGHLLNSTHLNVRAFESFTDLVAAGFIK